MDAETAIAISFGAVMAVFSFSLVYYTFVRVRQYGGFESNSFVKADDPELAGIFEAIKTLDLEYQLDRVSDEEFQAQFQAYRLEAAVVLKNQLESGRGDAAWALEQEILLALGDQDSVSSKLTVCSDCSAAVMEGIPSCPHCGAEMALS